MKLFDIKDIESYDIENHKNTDIKRHDSNKPKLPDNNSEFILVMGDDNNCFQTNKRQEIVNHCETYLMPSMCLFTPLAGNNNSYSEIQDIEDCALSELNTKDHDTLTDIKSHRTINQPAQAHLDSDYLVVLSDNNDNNDYSEMQDIEDCAHPGLNTKDHDTLTDIKSHRTINQPAPAHLDSDYLLVLSDNNDNNDYSEMQDIKDCAHPGLNTKDHDKLTDIKSHRIINQPAPAHIDSAYLVVLSDNNDCLQINVAQEAVCHRHF